MPVARIYTRFPEEAAPLIARLRARGYHSVEVVDPGHFRVTPADLEIELDRLRVPEALAAAARFARARAAEVFVAAGFPLDAEAAQALRGATARRNALLDGLKHAIGFFRRLGEEVHNARKTRRQRNIDLELAQEAARKQRAEQKAAERAERQRREEEERKREERDAALARQREEDARLRAEREARLAQQRAEEERARQRRAEEAARLAAEEAERRRVAEEVAAAERERRHEEERRRAIEGAAALVAAQRRQTPVETPASRRLERQRPAAAVAEPPMRHAMKRAFVAAAFLAALATIGWGAYQNRMPAQPLSNHERVRGAEIQQEVPFGAARIPAKPQAQPAPQAKPTQAQPAAAPKPTPKPRAQRYAGGDVDVVAEDEVIYHRTPKRTNSRAAADRQQDGVKRISDLDDEEEE